ncbi:MAG TPA: alkaline phosphatase family protein [Anaerolineae bacterium]|nr:alkaline phosphatase family protein [Anaerolineae bacterium]
MNKTMVIGLDGAPYPLVKKWAAEGYLPHIAKLIERGSFGVLNSTIPVHSPTAWASFITGLNPGKHGVFDFVRREEGGYQLRVVRANQIPGASLWRLLGEKGRKVGVMNVPMTYPPEPVNGFLLSGLGTPDYVTYSFPEEMTEKLNAEGYRVNKKFFFVPERQDEWLDDIEEMTDIRGEAAVRLYQEHDTDFFMVVFRNSDEICHFYWHHMDESHPKHDPAAPARYKTAIRDLYARIDKWVGELVAVAGEETNIVLMSDHGAGPLYQDVFLNEWLWEKGWLKLKEQSTGRKGWVELVRRLGLTRKNISDTLTRLNMHWVEVMIKRALGDRIHVLPRDERPEFLDAIDWEQTKAYSFGYYGQIFINLQGREPEGIVSLAEYGRLRAEIAAALAELVDPADGKKVVDKVYTREELYHGGELGKAPDLLAIMRGLSYITRKGYEFAPERGLLFREPYTTETGSHRLEGIVIGAGPDIGQGDLAAKEIQDLAPTLLHLMGCPVPKYMDGKVITEMLAGEAAVREVVWEERPLTARADEDDDDWDDEAEAEVTERLKQLGYLG